MFGAGDRVMCIKDQTTDLWILFNMPPRIPEKGRMYLVRQMIGCPCRLDLVGLDSPTLKPEWREGATVRCDRCWQEFPSESPVGWSARDFVKIVSSDVEKGMEIEENLPDRITSE